MEINTLKDRVLEYVQKQIDDDIYDRPLLANTCINNAVAYAVGKGTNNEMSLLQKMTILIQLPDFGSFRIGYSSVDPDDELSSFFEAVFHNEIASMFKETQATISATSIERHLLTDAEAVLEIANYREDSKFIDKIARKQIRAAVSRMKDRTADADDVATAIEAGSILRTLMAHRNDHKLHVIHGTSIERIDQITEKLRQLRVLARRHRHIGWDQDILGWGINGMNKNILEMVADLNNARAVTNEFDTSDSTMKM